ncbi:MAG: hypothetical protein A2X49_14980 [Lentisphaerae bacterium GWF2_52_8]|nr:MAG: hypothetical protein A2X49_14980 [Lentisphaerae bacterium GWF2_52_8]
MFGNEITAIFTDESKYYGAFPWTPGLFEDFQEKYNYDLRPRLFHLFSDIETEESLRTKLNYREYCGRRFEEAWLKPVSAWCLKHNLKLVGHLSPEEEPVSQSQTLSNLMPLQKYFSLAGLDLIVPAVGDDKHPLLNIGILSAASAAQQHRMGGVMSESLACSGNDCTIEKVRRIFNWQTVMGMSTPVVHGIFHSLRAEREFECPPDFGPASKFRDGLRQLSKDLAPVQEMLLGATQIAPVAILWPIKSFHLSNKYWQAEAGGLREELTALVLSCLDAQVGIHLLDEADFHDAKLESGVLKIGNATYSHIIAPASRIWTKATWDLLLKYSKSNIKVYQHGTRPRFLETASGVEENQDAPFKELTGSMIKNELPRLMDLKSASSVNIRITGWIKNDHKFYLLTYLGENTVEVLAGNGKYELSGQSITAITM